LPLPLLPSACRSRLIAVAAWADRRRGCFEYRPAAVAADFYFFAQHSAHHRSASGRPAWPGSYAGSPADLLEGIRAALNGLDDDALANFVAQADGPVGVDDRLEPVFFCLFGGAQTACSLRSSRLLKNPRSPFESLRANGRGVEIIGIFRSC